MNAGKAAVALASLLIASVLAGYSLPRAQAQDLTGSFAGDMAVALQGFAGLDPQGASVADRRVLDLIYDSLGRIDPVSLQVESWAATTWAYDGDKNMTVTLRDDLTFSDGSPYDAYDVAASLAQYVTAGVTKWKVIVVDERTLRFAFHRTTVPSVTAMITDNDVATMTVTPTAVAVVEGGATATYSIVLASRAPTANVVVTILPRTQTTVSPGSLTFGTANWTVPQTVTVTAANDVAIEGAHVDAIDHAVTSTDTAYNGFAIPDVVVQIDDNDDPRVTVTPLFVNAVEAGATATYSVVFYQRSPTANVTVSFIEDANVTHSPAGNLTFTTANWNTPQTVTVTAVNDAYREWNHIATIAHSVLSADPAYNGLAVPAVTVGIQDNDVGGGTPAPSLLNLAEGGATGSYSLVLWKAPSATVTVTISHGAQVTAAPATLTFTTANWNTPQTVTVTVVNDAFREGLHSDLIAHTAASVDLNYSGESLTSVTVVIVDNDDAAITVSTGTLSLAEGRGGSPYSVVLSRQPLATVTITLSIGNQVTVSSGTLTFTTANWNTPQTVTVTAVDDTVVEWGHTITITHSAQSGDPAYDGIPILDVSVGILDNDEAGVAVTPTTVNVAEGGATAAYSVWLWRAPTQIVDIAITIAAPPPAQVSLSRAMLSFSQTNWSTPQTVTVTAINDAAVEGPHTGTVTGVTSSADPDYDAVSPNRAGPGQFWTEALTTPIAWDSTPTRKYSGPFAVRTLNATAGTLVLEPNPHHFMGRPFLDTVTYRWPYTLELNPNNTTKSNDAGCALMKRQIHLIGWHLTTNELSDLRDCVAGFGGWGPDDPGTVVVNESLRALVNPDPRQSLPHVLPAKNPGTDFLYFGFSFNTGSVFTGGPGSSAQLLRSAIYKFVNKFGYRDVEQNTRVTHGIHNQANVPWAPLSCAPFTPCNAIVETQTVPAPAPVNRKTDTDPGIMALNNAGFLDRDGDGLRQTPTGADLSFQLLAPSFKLDPRKTTIANDMQNLMRGDGQIDVTVQYFDTQADLDGAINACTANCMYVKRFRGATQLPDWVSGMKEVQDANDANVDNHLTLGRNAWTLADRTLHVGHVSHFVGADAVILPVLHFDTLEAFDSEAFSGWVDTFEGINQIWSFTNLRLPALGSLTTEVSFFPRTLQAGGVGAVFVEVRDGAELPVADVVVSLSATEFPGALQDTTGVTNSEGLFRTNYTAPSTTRVIDDTIWVTATKVQYTGSVASTTFSVHPLPAATLTVAVSRGPIFEIGPGQVANITVVVEDEAGPVAGARVVLHTDLPGGTFGAASGTTSSSGEFRTTFSASSKQGMTYKIIAEVSATGYDSATGSAGLQVRGIPGTVDVVQTTRNVPGFEVAAAIGAVVLTFALVALARRRED